MLTVDDFDFPLPPELIAQHPSPQRRASRLLHLAGETRTDRHFAELPALIAPGDLLVFNDTRVIRARLFGVKESGGRVEVMIERVLDARRVQAQLRASKSPKPGSRLLLENAFGARVIGRSGANDEFFDLELAGAADADWWSLLDAHGRLPLPPYITHPAEAADDTRYQTVFARHPGAVAAPTAGLHFDEALLDELRAQGVDIAFLTLHVGAGTFQPVRVERIDEHRMHHERYAIPAATLAAIAATRARGGRVVAVGTTSLRALEAAAAAGAFAVPLATAADATTGADTTNTSRHGDIAGDTDIFITPGYRFRVVDRLLTNFHLPKSTLLMLVSAFAGFDNIRAAYAHAVAEHYRFFSYGDAMLLERTPDAAFPNDTPNTTPPPAPESTHAL
ncbi:tRNA preQ1(34) S-adenosylmethionine ribosyltransferase-isomerase QueA [Rhodocyclus tenuis]|uniref:tRNA preQ1(34) S-adenosylmethionine ribosyltransferase-isomerase QueA n=1 Tax=Rhodocyclus tenuis TaxID=1066 RepID=UPI0019068F64|nr:tRNA preQ1(34) S-adenosylmethionine ribosyltransferase-isomerase QueA [Rhodocyclus tenuis]MBK1681038.1 tRNA preQ1(34) S-adenosylmethionine ribosyltransferase-isomerase QueA [Rhodocyclus tenuis]